jgi:hypothetical protein
MRVPDQPSQGMGDPRRSVEIIALTRVWAPTIRRWERSGRPHQVVTATPTDLSGESSEQTSS